MKPEDGISPGSVITNEAGIYFDLNPAVITNTTGLLVDAGVTGQAIGGSAKGNTTAVTNNSGGSFTTSSIIT